MNAVCDHNDNLIWTMYSEHRVSFFNILQLKNWSKMLQKTYVCSKRTPFGSREGEYYNTAWNNAHNKFMHGLGLGLTQLF